MNDYTDTHSSNVTKPTPTSVQPPAHGRHLSNAKRPRRWVKIVLLLVIFFSGMVTGGGLMLYGIAQRMQSHLADPQARAQTWANRVARRLNLDDTHKQEVARVMFESSMRFETIRDEVHPKIQHELDRMAQEVAEVLPSDKTKDWQMHFSHMRQTWFPIRPSNQSPVKPADQPLVDD